MTHPATAPTAPAPPQLRPDAALGPTLAWLVERAALDEEALAAVALARPEALAPRSADPAPLVQALLDAGRPADALRLVACALPPREGVWWAWVASRHAAQATQARADAARAEAARPDASKPSGPPPLPPSAAQIAAIAAVERWVTHPTDEHRRAAWDAAQVAGLDTPGGAAAAAVYFTGGSITPPNGPFVPPPAGVHVTIASTSVLLSAIATDSARLGEVAGAFVEQGSDIVRRLGGWDAAVTAAKQVFDAQAYQHAEASKPPKLPGQE